MLDTSIQVRTEQFDGPLALLLHLIQKDEMDIRQLDLTLITQQYLAYLAKMRDLNFDLAGEYLFMASTLLLLKSNNCVTEEENKIIAESTGAEAITSESELIRRLEELQKFQKLGEKLWSLPQRDKEIFVKPKVNRKAIIDSILSPMDLNKLTMSMIDLIQRNKRKYTVVKRDRLSIKEKLIFLKGFLKEGQQTNFSELMEKDLENQGKAKDVTNTIITFISLLELARLKKIRIFQTDESSSIYVDVVQSFEDFDVDLADGFVDENEEKIENDDLPPQAINENIVDN